MDFNKSQRFVYEHHHYHHYANETMSLTNNLKFDSTGNRKSKTKTKKFKKDSRSNSLSKQPQYQHQDDTHAKHVSDPEIVLNQCSSVANQLSPGLVNFSKILGKRCFKSFRLRRALNKQKHLFNSLDLFAKKGVSEPACSSNSNSNSRTNLSNSEIVQAPMKCCFDLDDKSSLLDINNTNTATNSYLSAGLFGDDEIENEFLSLNNSKASLSFLNKSTKYLNDSIGFNYSENNDSVDFGRSHRSSACDFEEFTGVYLILRH